MTLHGYLRLAWQSVTAPREVAALLLSIRPSREALWTAFALVVVLNALVFSISVALTPGAAPMLLSSPAVFLVLQAVALAGSILAFTGIGRLMGGRGHIEEIALLMIWMQGLRVLVQAVVILLAPLSAMLAGVAIMLSTALGVWIAVNFLDEAHDLGGPLRALAVLVLGVLAMAFGLSLLLTLAGVSPEGMMQNV
ncbi:YIP1 family protein [Maliponia aquimaris]|uniref:Yip1 domain protein n=1 Tax=Maliponia aquimaris TaxID=1673631 RepID=A0A238L525_9RHOB|nr:YIP1 family protein [Maliponia aquimaris]SMX50109.1 Yip1 domain protein [Maliponia aquimaris]